MSSDSFWPFVFLPKIINFKKDNVGKYVCVGILKTQKALTVKDNIEFNYIKKFLLLIKDIIRMKS